MKIDANTDTDNDYNNQEPSTFEKMIRFHFSINPAWLLGIITKMQSYSLFPIIELRSKGGNFIKELFLIYFLLRGIGNTSELKIELPTALDISEPGKHQFSDKDLTQRFVRLRRTQMCRDGNKRRQPGSSRTSNLPGRGGWKTVCDFVEIILEYFRISLAMQKSLSIRLICSVVPSLPCLLLFEKESQRPPSFCR